MTKHVKVEGQQDGEIRPFQTPEHDVEEYYKERTTKELTQERGAVYGHPKDHFWCTQGMYNIWMLTRGIHRDPVNHAVYMILDKLSRLAHTIDHEDSWDDISGYVACAKKILFEEKE